MSDRKISTAFVVPPVPGRENDWCAYYEDDDGEGPVGWGPTEAAAIADLKENDDE